MRTKTGREVKLRRPPACSTRRGDSCPRLPTPRASVPGVKQSGEAVIDEAREWARRGVAQERGQPAFARREPPDRKRDVGADEEAAGFIRGMEAPAHILERGTMACERLRLEIDISKCDGAGLHGGDQLAALTVDAGITDRTTGVVPDHETRLAHWSSFAPAVS